MSRFPPEFLEIRYTLRDFVFKERLYQGAEEVELNRALNLGGYTSEKFQLGGVT